jgi:hypothetical protein
MQSEKFNSILINGHSFLGYYFLGVLKKFQKEDKLVDIKNFTGISLGSIICLFLILELDLEYLCVDEELQFNEIESYFFKKKVYDYDIIRILEYYISLRFKTVPTLSQLYLKTEKEFNIGVYNMETLKIEYLSHYTNPSMSVLEAISYSCFSNPESKEFNYINPSFLNVSCFFQDFLIEDKNLLVLTPDEKDFIKENKTSLVNYENQKKLKVLYPNITFLFVPFYPEDFSDIEDLRYECYVRGYYFAEEYLNEKEKSHMINNFFNKGINKIKKCSTGEENKKMNCSV